MTVNERLARLEERLNQREDMDAEQDRLIREIHAAVHGDGYGEAPGLKGRIDRIEQRNSMQLWALSTLFTILSIWLSFKD